MRNSNAPIDGVKIYPGKWFNLKIEMIPGTDGSTPYFVFRVYIDGNTVYEGKYSKPKTTATASSFRILAVDKLVYSDTQLDNVELRTLPAVVATDRLDSKNFYAFNPSFDMDRKMYDK